MTEIDFFREELESRIKHFEKESSKHKVMYRKIKYAIFVLTGLSTVLAGIAVGSENARYFINIAILIVTATVSVVSSVEGLRKPNELWIMERSIYHSLKDLRREFEWEFARSKGSINTEDMFYKMQNILTSAGENWSKNMQSKKAFENKV
jgi:hypothetical protein